MPELLSSPQLIGEVSLKSFNFHSGIILLEKQILILQNEEKTKKKKSSSTSTLLTQMWAQLVKLYKALEDEDVLRGLRDKEFAKHPYTRSALDFELGGDFVEALKIYDKAIEQLDKNDWGNLPKPTTQEVEFWENARLECLMKLTRWEDLGKCIFHSGL